MSSTIKKIRCFKCNRKVYKELNEDDINGSYAIVPLKIKKKRGCICSECLEKYAYMGHDYSDEDEIKNDDITNFSPPSQREIESIEEQESPTDSASIGTLNYVSIMHQIELARSNGQFKCLEYSINTLCQMTKRKVFGQDETVHKVVYALWYNQYLNLGSIIEDIGINRRNILIIGDTGTGKTFLSKTIAKTMGIVHSISNATPITSAGYIGEKVENIIERLITAANGDITVAQNGIVILDEFDKKKSNHEREYDSNGTSVQQELLKILEPTTIYVGSRKEPFYTGNLSVILLGACVGLNEVIEKRTKKKVIGFKDSDDDTFDSAEVTADDLIEFGFIPEIVGRINTVCKLNQHTLDTLTDIIYFKIEERLILFNGNGFDLIVSPLLITKIATEALNSKTGARDLEARINSVLDPALEKIFQIREGGICEIRDDGSAEILINSNSNSKKKLFEIIQTAPISEYADSYD